MRFDRKAIFIKKGEDILCKGKLVRNTQTEEYEVSERQVPLELRHNVLGSLSENSLMLVVNFDTPYYDEVVYLGEKYNINQIYKFKHKTGFILGDRLS